jgi:hypothetical protein
MKAAVVLTNGLGERQFGGGTSVSPLEERSGNRKMSYAGTLRMVVEVS